MQRNLTGIAGIILSLVAFAASTYHLYTGFFGQPEAYLHRVIHVTLMMFITFMSYSAFSRADDGKVPWYDVVIVIGLWFVTMGYTFLRVRLDHRAHRLHGGVRPSSSWSWPSVRWHWCWRPAAGRSAGRWRRWP